MIRIDFYLHFSVSVFMLLILWGYLGNWKKAIGIVVAIQLGKEVTDYIFKGSDVDWIDFIGDGLALGFWHLLRPNLTFETQEPQNIINI